MLISDSTDLKAMSLDDYKEMKLGVLEDFCIYLTDDEKYYLRKLENDYQVDQFCYSKIMNK